MAGIGQIQPENDTACVRPHVVRELRHQLAIGAYDPPVNELVERLVSVVIARHGPHLALRGE